MNIIESDISQAHMRIAAELPFWREPRNPQQNRTHRCSSCNGSGTLAVARSPRKISCHCVNGSLNLGTRKSGMVGAATSPKRKPHKPFLYKKVLVRNRLSAILEDLNGKPLYRTIRLTRLEQGIKLGWAMAKARGAV